MSGEAKKRICEVARRPVMHGKAEKRIKSLSMARKRKCMANIGNVERCDDTELLSTDLPSVETQRYSSEWS